MGEMSFDFPADLKSWIEVRLADGRYADVADYVSDLIRRDQAGMFMEAVEETPEYIAWVRERIAEGEASGLIEQDTFEFLAELRAGRHDGAG